VKSFNLFPQDTRVAELASCMALALLLLTILVSGSPILMESSKPCIHWEWAITSLLILQLIGLLAYPKQELLRTIMCWVNGSFWVWVGLSSLSTDHVAIGLLTLGLTNLYAFVVNVSMLRFTWKL